MLLKIRYSPILQSNLTVQEYGIFNSMSLTIGQPHAIKNTIQSNLTVQEYGNFNSIGSS
jgi:hypothetical protein